MIHLALFIVSWLACGYLTFLLVCLRSYLDESLPAYVYATCWPVIATFQTVILGWRWLALSAYRFSTGKRYASKKQFISRAWDSLLAIHSRLSNCMRSMGHDRRTKEMLCIELLYLQRAGIEVGKMLFVNDGNCVYGVPDVAARTIQDKATQFSENSTCLVVKIEPFLRKDKILDVNYSPWSSAVSLVANGELKTVCGEDLAWAVRRKQVVSMQSKQ